MGKIPATHLIITIVVMEFFMLLIWALFSLIFRSKSKAALLVSLFLVWFFFYGNFFNIGRGQNWGEFFMWRHKYIFAIWNLAFGIMAFSITKRHSTMDNLTNIINVFSALLVIFCFIEIAVCKLKTGSQEKLFSDQVKEAEAIKTHKITFDKPPTLPDIYYIILDGYMSYNTLRKYYDFDNGIFYNYLTKKGFYIAHNSRSNYSQTKYSFPSSLNMEYLQNLFDKQENFEALPVYHELTKNNKVESVLRKKGYKYICIGFGNKYADLSLFYNKNNKEGENDNFPRYFFTNLFVKYLLSMTFLSYITDLTDAGFDSGHRESILYCFEKLAEINKIEGPKFIFAHILSPHPPYAFGPNGQKNTLIQFIKMGARQLYVRQLSYINEKVEEVIDAILSQSNIPPIIILQADHGLRIAPPSDSIFDPQNLEEMFGIFNAYYLPDNRYDILYDYITPVNTFKVILNHYFGTDYELLKDKSYLYFENEFIDVTHKIKND